MMYCAVCDGPAPLWAVVEGYRFTDCPRCGSISLDRDEIRRIDAGSSLRRYDNDYWQDEVRAARERAWGSSLALAAQAIHLCQRSVDRFIDIGSGDGSLLDAISYHLPSFQHNIYGIELFPPASHTQHPGYIIGDLDQSHHQFDCGVCVEVVEHLTPKMLDRLVAALARHALPGGCFVFNTGLSDYVRKEDRSYIDPLYRGHIVSYGFAAMAQIFSRHQFRVSNLGQRNWAFIAEYKPTIDFDLDARIWNPLPENLARLQDPVSGSLMAITARDSLRAFR